MVPMPVYFLIRQVQGLKPCERMDVHHLAGKLATALHVDYLSTLMLALLFHVL